MYYKKKHRILNQYLSNKKSKVGEEIICPICRRKFTKKQYSQAFDCLQCKDKYHNAMDASRKRRQPNWNTFIKDYFKHDEIDESVLDENGSQLWDDEFGYKATF